jgi:hypothetical protein
MAQALFIAALMVVTARVAWLVADLSHRTLDLRDFLTKPFAPTVPKDLSPADQA